MAARKYRAYDSNNNPTFYHKDIEGTGTELDPDKSGVVLKEGGITGLNSATPNKDGNIIQVLRYISNNLNSGSKSANFALATTAVETTLTTIANIICADYQAISLRLSNTGSVDLNGLEIQGFEAADFAFDYQLIASSSASYTTNSGKQSGNSLIPVVDSSGTLPALPASQKAGILINCKYFQRIRLQATVASGTTNIEIAGTLMS